MRVSVFGLGYVGCVSAWCLASMGHEVIGVDANQVKVDLVNEGKAPVVEERIGELIAEVVRTGSLRATGDVREAIMDSEVSLVCVGTPSEPNGSLCTTYLVERVTEQIGAALAERGGRHTVVFRSTMLPGTCLNLLVPILEKYVGGTAGVAMGSRSTGVPARGHERAGLLRPAQDRHRRARPGKRRRGDGAVRRLARRGVPGAIRTAEAIKYADNAFPRPQDRLRERAGRGVPGARGGLAPGDGRVPGRPQAQHQPRLPAARLRLRRLLPAQDLRSLVHAAQRADVSVPILAHVLPSNSDHLQRAVELVERTGKRRVGLFGLSFKPGTDDLRESPLVELAERLFGKGYDLRIYDANVSLSRLLGANREYIETRLPHLAQLLADSVDEVLGHAEVLLVGTRDPAVLSSLPQGGDGPVIVDLIHLPDAEARLGRTGVRGPCLVIRPVATGRTGAR